MDHAEVREWCRERRAELAEDQQDLLEHKDEVIMEANATIKKLTEEVRTLRYRLGDLLANAMRLDTADSWLWPGDHNEHWFCGCDGDKLIEYEPVRIVCQKCGQEGGAYWG